MSVNDELKPYFTSGRVTGRASLISIMADVEGFDYGSSMADRDALIRANWNADFASKLIGRRLDDIIHDEPLEWTTSDEPRHVSAGIILFGSDIDWETGVLEGEFWESLISEQARAIAATAPGNHLIFAPAKFVSRELLARERIDVDYAPLPFALYRLETA